jgi:Transmembrane amino acid transporter protein
MLARSPEGEGATSSSSSEEVPAAAASSTSSSLASPPPARPLSFNALRSLGLGGGIGSIGGGGNSGSSKNLLSSVLQKSDEKWDPDDGDGVGSASSTRHSITTSMSNPLHAAHAHAHAHPGAANAEKTAVTTTTMNIATAATAPPNNEEEGSGSSSSSSSKDDNGDVVGLDDDGDDDSDAEKEEEEGGDTFGPLPPGSTTIPPPPPSKPSSEDYSFAPTLLGALVASGTTTSPASSSLSLKNGTVNPAAAGASATTTSPADKSEAELIARRVFNCCSFECMCVGSFGSAVSEEAVRKVRKCTCGCPTPSAWAMKIRSDWAHLLITVILILIVLVLAVLIPDIAVVIGFRGVIGVPLVVIFPCLMYYRLIEIQKEEDEAEAKAIASPLNPNAAPRAKRVTKARFSTVAPNRRATAAAPIKPVISAPSAKPCGRFTSLFTTRHGLLATAATLGGATLMVFGVLGSAKII